MQSMPESIDRSPRAKDDPVKMQSMPESTDRSLRAKDEPVKMQSMQESTDRSLIAKDGTILLFGVPLPLLWGPVAHWRNLCVYSSLC